MDDGRPQSRPPVVVVIGAGSASFGLSTLAGLLRTPALRGLDLRLVDVDPTNIDRLDRLAHRASLELVSAARITASTDRRDCLAGADFVVIAAASDREAQWRADQDLALDHGVTHYAENGGPGAFAHTVRSLDLILPIAADIERLAPDATVLVFTNPLRRVCAAIRTVTGLRVIGLCHGIASGYAIVAMALRDELGLQLDDDPRYLWREDRLAAFDRFARIGAERVAITAAGINHFTWMVTIQDRVTGEDLLPLVHRRMQDLPARLEPLTQRMFATYGLIPVQGDTHIAENVSAVADASRGAYKRYDIQSYDFAWGAQRREDWLGWMASAADGEASLEPLRTAGSERAEHVIEAIHFDQSATEDALNIPNDGAIVGLPDDSIVEVSATLTGTGARARRTAPLPGPILELCRRQVELDRLSIEAYLARDREGVRRLFTLDPMLPDIDQAVALADAYLDLRLPGFLAGPVDGERD
jgi:alpha-galactosidase